MLSKNMYEVLSCLPKDFSDSIKYETLLQKCKLPKGIIDGCLNETLFPAWNYIRSSNGFKNGSDLFITESGLARVEAYEQSSEEHDIVKKSLLIARISLIISLTSSVIALVSMFI